MDTNTGRDHNIFSTMYRIRFRASKNGQTVVNLSLLFCIIALLSAPWLVIIGAIAALVMGYRFSVDQQGIGFEQNFDEVVRNAAQNVKNAVDGITEER
ncbi:MAG: DUF4342 domain-containing protein [Candidatus Limiplasma sp.]|nr:DUF4342 domain-containing protein [Candidatus Limiplasma sp.]MEA5145715.1 DUF4342 domain-containing protein [Candidatus Limiplasma sp.]